MRRVFSVVSGVAVLGSVLACFGGSEDNRGDPEVESAMDELQASTLQARGAGTAQVFDILGGGAPPMESGSGVQVVHVAPLIDGRKPLQAAVVFDRPMVPLSDLDRMSDVPLDCEPAIPHRARWAGTTTAVWIPDAGSFPLATRFTCHVPAGTAATDGVALEKRIEWSFETVRPKVERSRPAVGATGVDPTSPIDLYFSQPTTVQAVAPLLSLVDKAGRSLAVEIGPGEGDSHLVVRADLVPDTSYTLTVSPGLVGTLGPLASTEPFALPFETFPPLAIAEFGPTGANQDPFTRLEAEFSTPVTDAEVAKHLTIEPRPKNWSPSEGTWASRRWGHYDRLEPRTTYTVTVGPGLTDQHGQTLGSPVSWKFTTGDFKPNLDVAGGFKVWPAHNPTTLPLKHLNVDAVHVEARALTLKETLLAISGGADEVVTAAMDGTQTRLSVEVSDEPNLWEIDTVELGPFMNTGLVAVDTWSPSILDHRKQPQHHRLLLAITSMGVTLKVGPERAEAWVTSLETGKPVAGAEVMVAVSGKAVGTATTDEQGRAAVPVQISEDWRSWREPVLALAQKGGERGVAFHDWSDAISPYQFDIYPGFDHDGQELAGWGYTDRGIYRPGHPVYAATHFRVEHAGGLRAPGKGEVSWTLTGPQGSEVASGTGTTSAAGNFSLQTELPKDGALGNYSLEISATFADGQRDTVWLSAPVLAYREPAFRVSVHADESALAGEEITGHLDARYMFGAALSGGEVSWRAWSEPHAFSPEGYDGWWFGPERRWWWEDGAEDDGTGTVASHDAPLAEATTWKLSAPSGLNRPLSLQLEAAVTDVDRQEIANRTEVLVHPTRGYVGLRPLERMPEAGEPTSVELMALTPEGTPAESATTSIEVFKRSWKRVREKGVDGRWQTVSQVEETEVHREERSVGGTAVTVSWTPPDPGTYVVRAVRTEEGGRSQVAEDRLYVRGSGYASWSLEGENQLGLVPDKRLYHLGDTARILVQSPVPGLEALVTVEREGVLWSEVITLEGTASTVEIPIDDAWLPNVYVSVVAVEGAPPQDSPDAGTPMVRVGLVELSVDREDARLKVAVATDREVYRNRDEVTVDLAVTHGDGSAAADVDVVLFAVDEAVLSLTAYETPDPVKGLIRHRSLSVLTGDSRTAVLDRAPYLTKGADDGGGGGDAGTDADIRKKFVTTVAWQPDLKTDANGRVQTTFELPDNLTAFRVMAVATTGDRFGSGDREITVTRPLIARPALPRRLRVGDEAFAGVVVHNNRDGDIVATVDGTVKGPVDLKGAPLSIRVPAHSAVEVPFRLKGMGVGEAVFTFTVEGGKERDALEWSLQVEEDLPLEVVATSGSTETEMSEKIGVPRTNRPDLGGLSVDVGTTALAGAGSGLDYLLEYPHGCLEQTTSRGLGALVAIRVREHAGLSLDEAQLRSVVQAALDTMPHYRSSTGPGLAYWRGGTYPSAMATAYAVEFMGRAKAEGFAVDEDLLGQASGYLRGVLAGKELKRWDPLLSLQARSYAAVALARADLGDAGHNNTLYDQRANLSVASTAALLEAIARTTGADNRTAALARALESRAYVDATSASIKENEANRWARLWGSDDLSTAAALEALLAAEDRHPLATKFALHLASSKTSGRWANTRATAGVLSALATYAERYETGDGARTVTATLAGTELLSKALALPESARVQVPLAKLKEGDLVVKAEGGRVYYEHRLAYAPMELKARDEGFTVIREVEIVDGGGPDGEVTAGATLAVTLRVVTPVVRHDVAVVDAIPAGWEPLNSSLATTSKAPDAQPDSSGDDEGGTAEIPAFGGSWVFDHHEIDDIEVRLYADYMPPGIHTFRYAARATTPGTFGHPPARAEAMYQPEIFGRTDAATMTVGRTPVMAKAE